MIKKISAIVLALVLSLSVLILPTSAAGFSDDYSLPSGAHLAYKLEWDKESYEPGETANLNVYFHADEATEIGAGYLVIGLNSSTISQDDNTADYIKGNASYSDLFKSFYYDFETSGVTWLKTTQISNISKKNTAAENALYDEYIRISLSRDMGGDYSSTTSGLPGSEINAIDEPMFTLSFVVDADAPSGTTLDAGMPSGLETYKTLSNVKYYLSTGKTSNLTYSVGEAVATASVGKSTASKVALRFSDVKNQIRFDKTADGKYANTFDGRMVVSIDNLAEVVGADVNLASVQAKIKEIGFLYAKNGAINADTALAQIKGGAATYSVATGGGYISTGFDEADYAVTGIIHNIPDAEKATPISAAVYAIYDADGDGVDEHTVLVLNGGETFTFGDLYSRNFNTAFPA